MKKCNEEHKNIIQRHEKHGPSSFKMHNSILAFEKMNLEKGDVFADLGCGSGDYSLYASQLVGEKGKVYAVDLWPEMLESLNKEARQMQKNNIVTVESDICKSIMLEDNCADHCLISTVMHAQKVSGQCENLFPEINRILKPGAFLTIIECKKEEVSFGPPLSMRISPEELEKGVFSHGFRKTNYVDLGCNYMMTFKKNK